MNTKFLNDLAEYFSEKLQYNYDEEGDYKVIDLEYKFSDKITFYLCGLLGVSCEWKRGKERGEPNYKDLIYCFSISQLFIDVDQESFSAISIEEDRYLERKINEYFE